MHLLALRACIGVQQNFEDALKTDLTEFIPGGFGFGWLAAVTGPKIMTLAAGRERHVNRSLLKDALACAASLYWRAT